MVQYLLVTADPINPDDDGTNKDFWFNSDNSSLWIYDTEWEPITLPNNLPDAPVRAV